MEELTGMSRTNIRFYEGEGLIHPNRKENGYRDYSFEDAQILLKVKLLRSMDIPLDHVKAVASGVRRLPDVLAEREAAMVQQEVHQERTRQVIRIMQQAGTEFESLKPEELFTVLESETAVEDAPPRLNLPWRRYWARGLDFSLYGTLVGHLLYDFLNKEILITIGTLAAMLILEPLFLSLFGTTPGKAVFGIRVTDTEGARLDYSTALERTWTVMWEGMAMNIPFISWYFQYKSLSYAEDDIALSWEDESELTFQDDKMWRYILLAIAHLVLLGISVYSVFVMGG